MPKTAHALSLQKLKTFKQLPFAQYGNAPSLCRWGYCLQMENATAANSVARQTAFHARTVGGKIGRATDRHDARPRAEAPGDYQDPQNVQLNTFHEEHHASFSLMHTRRSPKSREEGTQRKEEVWCYPSTPALGVNPIRGFTPRALRRVAAEHAHALPRIIRGPAAGKGRGRFASARGVCRSAYPHKGDG